MRTRSRAAVLPAALLALSLSLAACGGDEPADEPDAAETSAPVEEPQVWPMTGLEATGKGVPADRPVLAVKIDNTASSAPQQGLGSADLVVEELVEGGVTRLAVFYDSDIPGEVGPVRSMRASDIGIVSPADATVVTSGAAPVTLNRLKEAGVPFVTEGSEGFSRAGDRSAPYNLMADLTQVSKAVQSKKTERPEEYLPWGTAEDLPAGAQAATLTADFGSHSTVWTWSKRQGYVNQNSYAADGDEFPADSILVLRAKVGDAGYRDPAGNPVPETKFEGTGQAMLFHDGTMVRGTWSKKKVDSPLTLTTEDGAELSVPAGKVWVELVPDDKSGGSVTFGK